MQRIRYLIFFLFFSLIADDSFSISQDPARNFFSGSSVISQGSVNVITGDFVDTTNDLYIDGPDSLQLSRGYVSSSHEEDPLGFSFSWNHHGKLHIDDKKATYHEGFGQSFHFSIAKNSPHFKKYRASKKSMNSWTTNLGSGKISGRTNQRNNYLYNIDGTNKWTPDRGCFVVKSDGERHHFLCYDNYFSHYDTTDSKDKDRILHSIWKPKGTEYHYSYDPKGALQKIQASINKTSFADLTFTHEWRGRGNYPFIKVEASNGQKVEYTLRKIKVGNDDKKRPIYHYMLDTVQKDGGFFEKYHYTQCSDSKSPHLFLWKKEYPNNRYLKLYYDEHCRIKKQFAPVGKDDNPIPIFSYQYYPKATTVYDALGHYKKYLYDDASRLREIQYYNRNNTLSHKEQYHWRGSGEIRQNSLVNAQSQEITTTQYFYDHFGNVTSQQIKANFTGKNDDEIFEIKRDYSQDGKNLLLTEDDGRKKIAYTYDDITDLPLSKCVITNKKRILRTFYRYDQFSKLCLEITDDGSSPHMDDLTDVTQRHIKRITSTTTAPIGLPEIIEEKFLESGEEKLLKKTINHYSTEGYLIQQDHHDANDNLIYSLFFQYDERGNRILETDPLGQTIQTKYDLNNNCIFEQGKRKDYHKEYKYDFSNRLIQEDFVADQTFSKYFDYDYCNNKISETDFWGNKTHYTYDELSREIQVTNAENITTKKEYNALNQLTTITDGNNNTKKISYTMRGDPIDITYPDGTQEHFVYSLDGLCLKHILQDNSYTTYTYDDLGHVTQKTLYSSDNQPISTTSFVYNAFHLLSETDAIGNETKYYYDVAGRLIKKQNHATTEYIYDSLNRLHKTIEWTSPQQALITIQEHDLLDRLTEERVEDESGRIHKQTKYLYDADNNIIEKIDGNHSTKKIFDIFGNCILEQDEEKNLYLHNILYDEINPLGKSVPSRITIDSLGNQKKTVFDAIQRPSEIFHKNSSGEITKHQQIFYDACNNKTKLVENVIANNQPTHQSIILWEYDVMGRETQCIESPNTDDTRITTTMYNDIGQKEKVIKPSGIIIFYCYDNISRLQELYSSDNTVHYAYKYDALHRPLIITDLITKTQTKKAYDKASNISHEHLANKLFLNYQYDDIGRVVSIHLPDNSSIRYEYQGPHFSKISRHTPSGKMWYDHTYDEIDLRGNILSAHCNDLNFSYSRDSTGKVTSIQVSDKYQQQISYDTRGNIDSLKTNINKKKYLWNTTIHEEKSFGYDSLSQLTQVNDNGKVSTYLYDSLYNPLEQESTPCSCNNLNELTSDGTNNYYYSKDGNLIQINNDYKLHYDALDRLIAICHGDQIIHYTYDADNRRLTKTEDDNTTINYLYIGNNEVGAYVNNQLTQFRVLGVGKGAEIGATIAIELNNKAYSVISDVTGNIAALVDKENDNIVTCYTYESFGKKKVYGEIESPWTYCSKREDTETGFIYFGERYYYPQMQRWISKDPLSYSASNNLYTYVSNNPLNVYDLYGLWGINITLNSHLDGDNLTVGVQDPKTGIGIGVKPTAFYNFSSPSSYAKPSQQYHPAVKNPNQPSRHIVGDYEPDPQVGIVFVNGINNPLDFAKESATIFANLFERQAIFIHNPTRGAVHAFLNQVFTISKNDPRVLAVKEAILESLDDHEMLIIGCHSQGAYLTSLATQDLSPEQKAKISIYTFGGAKMIPKEHVAHVRNYVNRGDPVPFHADCNNYKKGLENGSVHKLQTNSRMPSIKAHDFRHKNYQKVARDIGDNIKDIYGRGKLCIKD